MPASLVPHNSVVLRSPRSPPSTPQHPKPQTELQGPRSSHRQRGESGDPRADGTGSSFIQKSSGRPGLTYEPVQKLGEGAFGVAHLVRDKRSGQLRVLKTINKRQSQVPPAQMEHETRSLKACDHPNVIRLFEYYEDYENIYLIMERAAGGELHQVLMEQRKKELRLPERWVATVVCQCLQAIAYVHSMGIIHKDLKSENILLLSEVDPHDPQMQPHAVIIDLGIAELFSARLGRRARCNVVAGTPTHMAPEVWRGNFGPVADIWSLGVVLFELLSGDLPFLASSHNSAAEWIRMHRQGPNWLVIAHASAQARALCQRMLSSDDRMRPTAQQCLRHCWFEELGYCHELQRLPEGAREAAAVEKPSSSHSNRSDAKCLDVDATKKIDYNELASACLDESLRGILWQSFCNYDVDGNGVLGFQEIQAVVSSPELAQHGFPGLGSASEVDEVLARMELDANGRISFEELSRYLLPERPLLPSSGNLQKAFEHVDANAVDHGTSALASTEFCGTQPLWGTCPKVSVSWPAAPINDETFAQLLDEIEADNSEMLPSSEYLRARLDLDHRIAEVDAIGTPVSVPSTLESRSSWAKVFQEDSF